VLTVVLWGVAVRLMYRPASTAYFTPVQAAAMPSGLWQQPPEPLPQQVYGQSFDVVVPSRYAPWHTRALSGLIDHGVPTVIFFVFYVPFGNGTYGMGGNRGLLVMLAVIVVLIAVQVWNSAFRQGSTGQSWGKQVVKTRLLDEWTGLPLGAGKAFLRLLAHFLDSAPATSAGCSRCGTAPSDRPSLTRSCTASWSPPVRRPSLHSSTAHRATGEVPATETLRSR